ncbi:hypothetical protein [Streptomyces sp. HSG2]|uniref:hypothetical protein n=1 Tax=Streptomyces sp. HSG2 TaxID=2797167 RepID=UPI0019081CED|nr:hypothetical protein [Streptomyces sp. HSG2]
MSMWGARARSGAVVATALMVAPLGLVGCAGGEGNNGGSAEQTPRVASPTSPGDDADARPQEHSETWLAEMKGPAGLLLLIKQVRRDDGGFLTVDGELKNDGGETTNVPAQLSGTETEITRNGRSLGGATMVDPVGKKRYYVLRDTDGRPLTTVNFPPLKAGESLPVFMQFPAPPSENAELTLHLPMFSSAGITIPG